MIDKALARRTFDEAVAWIEAGSEARIDWVTLIEDLSRACEQARARTHIAFVGTAILAKVVTPDLDVASLQAGPKRNGYSARSLTKDVLVPAAFEHGVHLGVTSREPLNNQPYLAIAKGTARVTLDTLLQAMKADGKEASEACALAVCGILERLATTPSEAIDALRAFVGVRRRYARVFDPLVAAVEAAKLLRSIERLGRVDGGGGRVAQALAAGLLDAAFGEDRVETSRRVNDPDRHLPADVAVRGVAGAGNTFIRAIEVRDKLVSPADVLAFGRKMGERGIPHALMLAVARNQPPLAPVGDGPTVAVCSTWADFLTHLLFWAQSFDPKAAAERVYVRLIEIEAPEGAVKLWHRETREPEAEPA